MKYLSLLIVTTILSAVGFSLGRSRSYKTVNGEIRKLHSLPGYYGLFVALWCGIPALVIFVLWIACESSVIISIVVHGLPPEIQSLPEEHLSLVINDIRNIANGIIVSGKRDEFLFVVGSHTLPRLHIFPMECHQAGFHIDRIE